MFIYDKAEPCAAVSANVGLLSVEFYIPVPREKSAGVRIQCFFSEGENYKYLV